MLIAKSVSRDEGGPSEAAGGGEGLGEADDIVIGLVDVGGRVEVILMQVPL